jgi:hypothetical protein
MDWVGIQSCTCAELAKCVVRCNECHNIKTRENGDLRNGVPLRHGDLSMYGFRKCRCDLCKATAVQASRDYRARKRLDS